MTVEREALLARAKDALSETGLPAHVTDALVTELHNRVYWPEIEKLQSPKKNSPKKIREIREAQARNRVQINGSLTSLRAAIAQTPDKSQWYYRNIYLLLLQNGPATDEQILAWLEKSDAIHVTSSSARTRRDELVKAGWVEASEEFGRTKAGQPCIVWRALVK